MQILPENRFDSRAHDVVAVILAAAMFSAILWLTFSRHYFGFSTETDFLSHIIQDAENLLNGQPLLVLYHPPLYPISLALFQSALDDWFLTGRIVSVLASAIVILTSYLLFRHAISATAGLGALIALAISPLFITYSTFATSDIFFLALYCSALLIAYFSDQRQSGLLWAFTGVIVGLALLTRTNAITLLLLLGIPLLSMRVNMLERVKQAGYALAGFFIPIIAWLVFAHFSGSNFMPTEGTAVNLALNYFKPDGVSAWADGRQFARENFHSVWDVIARDPVHVAKEYLKDFYRATARLLEANKLMSFPGALFMLPAVLALFFYKQPRWLIYVALLALAQILLVNLKQFEARFYLFLLGPIGALVGEFVGRIYYDRDTVNLAPKQIQRLGSAILVLICLASIATSVIHAHNLSLRDEIEVTDSVPKAMEFIGKGSLVVSRKPVIAYYTSADHVFLPMGKDMNDLLVFLSDLAKEDEHRIFLYYGSEERRLRPEYSELADPETVTASFDALSIVARASSSADWTIYEYQEGP